MEPSHTVRELQYRGIRNIVDDDTMDVWLYKKAVRKWNHHTLWGSYNTEVLEILAMKVLCDVWLYKKAVRNCNHHIQRGCYIQKY